MNALHAATRQGYENRCRRMLAQVEAWRKGNPDKVFTVQWKLPAGAVIIATLKQGIENGFVIPNAVALELFTLWGWLHEGPDMPTILQARTVLEIEVTK